MSGKKFFLSWQRFYRWLRVLPTVVAVLGTMLPLSPANAQQLSSSEEHLTTWTQLSGKFSETLNQHEQTLTELSGRLKVSENNGLRLTGLSDELLRQNEDLRSFNDQIGERMQERDEDLALSYDRIDALEKSALKHWIAHILMGCLIAGAIAFKVCRILKIAPI